jgi:hypothetical protein
MHDYQSIIVCMEAASGFYRDLRARIFTERASIVT